MKWKCSACSQEHDGLPLDYGADLPSFRKLDEDERSTLDFNPDWGTASLRGPDGRLEKSYFVRGVLRIPIQGSEEHLRWGVWTTLSEKNHHRFIELFDLHERTHEPPYFGWLVTLLPKSIYPDTQMLKTHVHQREPKRRPLVELEPTDHPLAVEQREGINWKRVRFIAEIMLHQE